jgi:ATP-binding cassette, subfamily B, bacterial CvaB/MchF/RaxB
MRIEQLQFLQRRHTPLLLQTEAAECGLACLGMVAAYHGYASDLGSLRRRYAISLKGTTLAHLMQIATELKLSSRAVRVDLGDLSKLACPAILHWDFNHFVVLVAVKRDRVIIHDPAIGMRSLALAEVSRHFTGVALELLPTEDFKPGVERRRLSVRHLLGHPRGLSSFLLQVLLLGTALEVFGVLSPFYLQLVVDQAITSEDRDLLSVLAVGFIFVALIQVGITAIRGWVLMVLGATLNVHLAGKLFRHLLRLPMTYFAKRHLGDVASRFESLNVIQRTLTTSFIEALVDGLMVSVTLALMLLYNWQMTLIVVAAATIYATLRLVLYLPLRQASEEQILRLASQQSNFLETVRGIQSIKLFNRQTQRRTIYHNLLVANFNAGVRIQKLQIAYKAMNGFVFGLENVLVVWLAARQVLEGGFSVGMLFAFISYKQQFTTRVINLIEKGIEFRMLGLHTERVSDVALSEPEPADDEQPHRLHSETPIGTAIEVRALSYRYSDAEPAVLENVDLVINSGESVAIVGASGCGKTTLLKLLLGLLQPTSGQILIGGIPLQQLNQQHYRRLVGTVMQDDQLFAGSIADNISFFDPQPNQEQIEVCAELAAVHQDIQAMPMAYNTLIGDMGTVLSGGQKQRILLARALYKRPRILFLDEATSHLDVIRERRVNEAVRRLRLTRVIIAHRPETIAAADRVIVLGRGQEIPQEQSFACA